jgi:hypothetical protein
MNAKKILAVAVALSIGGAAYAGGSNDGRTYTNFGNDLFVPIFPKDGSLKIYKNRNDQVPLTVARGAHLDLVGTDWKGCIGKADSGGWVRCTIDARTGWVKRSDFLSGGEFQSVAQWPIRYWLYVASDGLGSDETYTLLQAAKRSPYLITPKEYDNIIFKVQFDREGFAISKKTGKKTGDRVFVFGKAVYLAPSDPQLRDKATWLFLSYFNSELEAMCPGESRDSCFSAVNLANGWPGINALYTSPAPQYAYDEQRQQKEQWYGAQEVAFARFADPEKPLMYRVPMSVRMTNDPNPVTDAQKTKLREKPFCLIDCSPN